MIQTRRLTIIPSDGAVYTDDGVKIELDLSSCNVPEEIHALQWNCPQWPITSEMERIASLPYGQGSGWIEFRSSASNQEITSLPEWAINCYNVYASASNE